MAIYYGCDIPEDLYFDLDRDVWIRFEGDLAVLGMTDVAQTRGGKLVNITFKKPGKIIAQGKSAGTVESGKWVGPVTAPVNGTITEVNAALKATPGLLNSDPYGAGWFVKIKPDNWDVDSTDLVTGESGVAEYQKFLDAQGINCGT